MIIFTIKIAIYLLLSTIYIFEIARHNAFCHYIAMTSSLNYRFLSCDVHKQVEHGRITTIEDCTADCFVLEWIMFFPVLVFQLYVLARCRTIRANVSQNLNKPVYQGGAAAQNYIQNMSGQNYDRRSQRGSRSAIETGAQARWQV